MSALETESSPRLHLAKRAEPRLQFYFSGTASEIVFKNWKIPRVTMDLQLLETEDLALPPGAGRGGHTALLATRILSDKPPDTLMASRTPGLGLASTDGRARCSSSLNSRFYQQRGDRAGPWPFCHPHYLPATRLEPWCPRRIGSTNESFELWC